MSLYIPVVEAVDKGVEEVIEEELVMARMTPEDLSYWSYHAHVLLQTTKTFVKLAKKEDEINHSKPIKHSLYDKSVS